MQIEKLLANSVDGRVQMLPYVSAGSIVDGRAVMVES
jgi:hypothetical protein